MTRERSKAVDEVSLTVSVRRHGRTDLTLVTPGREVAVSASDVLGDVILGVIDLCGGAIEGRACGVEFFDEPGWHRWTLTPVAARRHTMLFQTYRLDCRPGVDRVPTGLGPEVRLIVKRRQLATMLVGELWKIATLYREPSYRRGRRGFPFEPYHRLLRQWEGWASGEGSLSRIWTTRRHEGAGAPVGRGRDLALPRLEPGVERVHPDHQEYGMPNSYTLDPRTEAFIDAAVASGRYDSVDDLVREAVRLLASRELADAELGGILDRGLDDIRAGRVHDAEDVFDELEARYGSPAATSQRP